MKNEKEKSEEVARTTVRLPKGLLIDFRVQSVKEGRAMSQIIMELIKEYLAKKGKS